MLIRQSTVAGPRQERLPPVINDRVLAKIFPAKDRGGPAYTGRIIKILDKRRQGALLGVVQAT